MPSTATRTAVDITELGFDANDTVHADVFVDNDPDNTFVEVTYEDWVWTLTFDKYGELEDEPTQPAAPWLGPVIKKAAPRLKL